MTETSDTEATTLTPTSQEWVEAAEVWELEAQKKVAENRIAEMWADPDASLARDRYDKHDECIDLIRRIDARLGAIA